MIKLIQFLLLLIIFITPLITPFLNFGFEQAKVVVFSYFVDITAIIFLFYLIKNRSKVNFKFSQINYFALNFLLILFLTSLLGLDPLTSFFGTSPYYQGFLLYFNLFIFSILIYLSKLNLRQISIALISSSLLISLLAIWQFIQLHLLGKLIPTYAGRVVSTFGQPNFYAGFLLLILPSLLNLLKELKGKSLILGRFLVVILYIGILISNSRVSFIISSVFIVFWFLSFLSIKIKKIVFLALATSIVLSLIISLVLSTGLIYKEIFEPKTSLWLINNSPEKRVNIWPLALKIYLQKPLTGYGLENIDLAFSDYFKKNKHFLFEENLHTNPALFTLKDLNINSTHNYILDLGLYSGILGILAYLLIVSLMLKNLKYKYLLISLLTYLIWAQFQNQSVVQLMFFWMLMGLSIDKQYF